MYSQGLGGRMGFFGRSLRQAVGCCVGQKLSVGGVCMHVHIRTHVCMHACMHKIMCVGAYVCLRVCMYGHR